MELFFIRHGQSEGNAKVSESGDSVLTPLGHKQAEAAGHALGDLGIERLFCSLQQRSLQTASAIGQVLGLRPIGWLELCERGFCHKENGLSRSDISRLFPSADLPEEADELGWARHWRNESEEELHERMGRVAVDLRKMAQSGKFARIACVVHGVSCSMLLRRLLGVEFSSDARLRHDNCGISIFRFAKDRTLLIKLNDTRHTEGLV